MWVGGMDLSSQVGLRRQQQSDGVAHIVVGGMDLSSQVGLRQLREGRDARLNGLGGGMDLSSQVGLRLLDGAHGAGEVILGRNGPEQSGGIATSTPCAP